MKYNVSRMWIRYLVLQIKREYSQIRSSNKVSEGPPLEARIYNTLVSKECHNMQAKLAVIIILTAERREFYELYALPSTTSTVMSLITPTCFLITWGGIKKKKVKQTYECTKNLKVFPISIKYRKENVILQFVYTTCKKFKGVNDG